MRAPETTSSPYPLPPEGEREVLVMGRGTLSPLGRGQGEGRR